MGYGEGKKERIDKFVTYTWERPRTILGKRYTVAGPAIGPQDLKQGKLGNCYFIAALAAVAEYPDRIKRLIRYHEPNPNGVNCVALNITGLWEDIILDDRIPYNPAKKKAAFCRSVGKDLWVMLIEKAWAKVHGGYSNIEAGYINEALASITGAPVKIFRVKEATEDEAWRNLIESKQKDYITCASTSDITKVVTDTPNEKTGLSGSHSYSLLGAVEIFHNGKTVRLVKLRNPWGKGEWKGDWSDKSPLWTPELKKQVGVTDAEDGIFHMTFKDAGRYFHDFAICHYRNNYVNSAKKYFTSPEHPTILGFVISTPGEYYFKIHQLTKRIFKKSDLYVYSPMTIIIAKQEDDKLVYVGDASRAKDQIWVLANCSPGRYFAYITTPWKRDCNTLTFSIYGPVMVDFQAYDPTYLGPDFIRNIMLQTARENKTVRKDFSRSGHPGITTLRQKSSGLDTLTYYYYDNKSSTHALKVTATCKYYRNVEVLPPFTMAEGGTFIFYVDPGTENIIIVRQDGPSPKFKLEFKYAFKKRSR